ncbi:RNA polymerase III subunit F [Brevipalpus obovatus]|uniref:RNA polymerase III subunit F n=1 Tax=Brevipalpus obovatus TaxID=246614 RepID=UPI003D9E11B2
MSNEDAPMADGEEVTEIVKGRIIELLTENEKGLNGKSLELATSNVNVNTRARVINELLAEDKIELFKQDNGQLIYRLRGQDRKLLETDEERVVFSIIEDSANRGIWIKEIRNKSKLAPNPLNKVLKNMEKKKIIKTVQSIHHGFKKKVFMLYDIEPDRTVTGGTWYSNDSFESEFVEVLNQQCYKFLQRKTETGSTHNNPIERKLKSLATLEEIRDYITQLGISKVALSNSDIENILETLVFDGKVEKQLSVDTSSNINTYRAIQQITVPNGLMRMPCGLCPVSDECHIDGIISPSKCIYLKEWLNFQ